MKLSLAVLLLCAAVASALPYGRPSYMPVGEDTYVQPPPPPAFYPQPSFGDYLEAPLSFGNYGYRNPGYGGSYEAPRGYGYGQASGYGSGIGLGGGATFEGPVGGYGASQSGGYASGGYRAPQGSSYNSGGIGKGVYASGNAYTPVNTGSGFVTGPVGTGSVGTGSVAVPAVPALPKEGYESAAGSIATGYDPSGDTGLAAISPVGPETVSGTEFSRSASTGLELGPVEVPPTAKIAEGVVISSAQKAPVETGQP